MAPESISMMRESTAGSARGKTMTQTFVTHLECSMTGERHDADTLHGLSRAGWPLLVRYDLEAAAQVLSKATSSPDARRACGSGANCCRCAATRMS
jgi:threonine synthase